MITTSTDQLRLASAAVLARTVVGVFFRPQSTGVPSAWQVIAYRGGLPVLTDPPGNKTFPFYGENQRKSVLAKAQGWVQTQYSLAPSTFVANSKRDMVPAWVNAQFPVGRA